MEDQKEKVENLSADRKKELADRAKARAVVQEILNFGVNDNQVREIIKQLALELENRETMLKIFEFLGGTDEQSEQQVKVYT
jgi:hypothetical protein